ncbi:hypothetical protein BuS5_00481 [Desulfosarcina sp. BuS5]|uniref:MFS transporter n=1 Tax=Desulfosarcina sp. BuS5 TaxID=933262 RepID=UPI00048489B5|nr:MFS transporter [Desulfosarcina sp. BuS5]WDN87513.1 hypothetical protein BuS5_00481 [Desulfosarcina sp. BuS5]
MVEDAGNGRYAWIILSILFFSQVALSLGAYAWGPLGPFIKKSLSLSNVQFGSITSVLYLMSVVCSIPAGVSVDRWGVKINLFVSMLLMGTAMILAGFMESYIWLLILVVFTGASYGMINPIASKGLTLWFDVKNRATAFGIRQMGVTAGGAIAGILLIYLARLKNWDLAVLVVGLLSVLIGIAGYLFYKEAPVDVIKPAVSKKATPKMTIPKMTILDLLKNRNLIILCLIMALLCLGQSSIASFLVLYLKEHLGLTAILAGSFLTITMICGGCARVFWGIVSDRLFHSKRLPVMKIICLLAAVSALAVFLYGSNLPSSLFVPVVALFGFSYLGFQGIAVVLMVEACGPALAGRATGLGITIAWVGMVLGPVVFGALAEAGYQFAWLFITITSSLSVLLCYTINE